MTAIPASMVKELRERTGLGMMECKKALAAAGGDIEVAIEELRKSSGMKAARKAGRTAADGVVAIRVADDNSYGVLIEVNSETDFVARDQGFLGFVDAVVEKAFADRQTDVAALMAGDMEHSRQALVQKIGENISVRRLDLVEGAVVGGYVHSNNRIGVLTALTGATAEVARDVAMHVAAVNPQVARPEDLPREVLEKEKEIFTAQARESGKPEAIIEKMIAGRVNKFKQENSLVEQPFVKDPEVNVGRLVANAGGEVASFTRYEVGEGIAVAEVDFAAEVAAAAQASAS